MAGRLQGKTIIVTSAAQGMGRAAAIAMAEEGAKVFATDIRADLLPELTAAHKAIDAFELNVLKDADVAAASKRTGPADILFNCSGFVHHGTILDCADKDWDFSFDLNVKAHYRMIRAYLPGMLEKGKGNIVNMASVASSIKGVVNRAVYGASKAAVIGLTKAVAADYISKGIRCNCICPGTVETPSLYDRMRASGDFEKAKAAFIARQPMGRLASAEEVAKMIIYLASDESDFVTGQAFVIDGGFTL
ncbi:MAG: SDR family oxidoreductase [Rhizobiales bacterium]|nr:SDR family oxidoreductase [Hyphomicrobiales bacterium]